MQGQKASLEWRAGDVPVSTRFDDPYFSFDNGLEETRHVFLRGNGLPDRFADGFHIGELGFGTGLNFLTTLQAWRASGAKVRLHFTSFEAYPMPVVALMRALRGFAGLPVEVFADYQSDIPVPARIDGPDFTLSIIEGDARVTLPVWQGRVDAWYLDGFSPARNPELWEPALMREVARHTCPGGTAATYTAAGFVRRGLADAGFVVSREAGYGRKRHMTTARLPV